MQNPISSSDHFGDAKVLQAAAHHLQMALHAPQPASRSEIRNQLSVVNVRLEEALRLLATLEIAQQQQFRDPIL
ncbi:MAG: hypothetical protein ACRENM_08540 [Candidatus Dormibacteraceae bacterium]